MGSNLESRSVDRRRSVAAVWRSVAPPRVVVVARTALPRSRVEPWSRSRSRKSPSPVDPRSVAMCEVSFALDRARRRRARAPRRVASTRAVATRESRRVGYAVDTTHRNDARGRRTREGADATRAWKRRAEYGGCARRGRDADGARARGDGDESASIARRPIAGSVRTTRARGSGLGRDSWIGRDRSGTMDAAIEARDRSARGRLTGALSFAFARA